MADLLSGFTYIGSPKNKPAFVKKIYYGVNNLPKLVRKLYVGVNGVPKLVYDSEVLFPAEILMDNFTVSSDIDLFTVLYGG